MGCCFSKRANQEEDSGIEASSVTNSALTCKVGDRGDQIKVSLGENCFKIRGKGIVLGSCPLDVDTARWEVVVESKGVQIGVKRFLKKEPSDLTKPLSTTVDDKSSPSWILSGVDLAVGDVVGVYWDQTALPMLQFTLNGTLLSQSVNRVRPSSDIYPAISLSEEDGACSFIFDESGFKHASLSSKYQMIICSSSII